LELVLDFVWVRQRVYRANGSAERSACGRRTAERGSCRHRTSECTFAVACGGNSERCA